MEGLNGLDESDARVRLLETLCRRLGERLYPAFLQILLAVDRFADAPAKRVVADTLVHCLLSGRLPSGALSAWGASTLGGDSPFGQVRRLGPIEYVDSPDASFAFAEPQFEFAAACRSREATSSSASTLALSVDDRPSPIAPPLADDPPASRNGTRPGRAGCGAARRFLGFSPIAERGGDTKYC